MLTHEQRDDILRLSIMNCVLEFYSQDERTKTISKIMKNVKKGMKKISTIDYDETVAMIKETDEIWKKIFDGSDTKVAIGYLVSFIWTERMTKYGFGFKTMEKYCASETVSSLELEQATDRVAEQINSGIGNVLSRYK